MTLAEVIKPPAGASFGHRFFLVGYLPTYAALIYLLVLIWAGAPAWLGHPGHRLSFTAAWSTAAHLGVGQILMLALVITLVAVLLQPFQLSMVRFLEGSWPAWLAAGLARRWQLTHKGRLARKSELPQDDIDALTDEVIQRAGAAGDELRRRFPLPDNMVRPTALGNALAAMEDNAGRAYGLDAVVAWPRLYPVLGEQVRAIIDDRRDNLDAAARMTVTMAVTAVAAVVLLARSGAWLLLAVIPLVVAVAAYYGAVQTALAFGDAVRVAFDLHRFDLLTALRLKLPTRQAEEHATNEQWCDHWRQGVPLPSTLKYVVGKEEEK